MSTSASRMGSGDPNKNGPNGKVARAGSCKVSASMIIEQGKLKTQNEIPQVYELSLKTVTKKPQKLKPLKNKGTNLAVSLLENDRPTHDLEGIPTSADLDNDTKDYMDATKIFKQFKTAFQPSNSASAFSNQDNTLTSPSHKSSLDPITEECQSAMVMSEAQSKVRSKKIEQLLSKVKKATMQQSDQKPSKSEVVLAITAPPPTKNDPYKKIGEPSTFLTSCVTAPP